MGPKKQKQLQKKQKKKQTTQAIKQQKEQGISDIEEESKTEESQQQQQQQKNKVEKQPQTRKKQKKNPQKELSQEEKDFQLAQKMQEEFDNNQNKYNKNQQQNKMDLESQSQDQIQQPEEQKILDENQEEQKINQNQRVTRSKRKANYNVDDELDRQIQAEEDLYAEDIYYTPLNEEQKKASRVQRAKTQKIYLMQARRITDEEWEFLVKGSQGKDYRININTDELKCGCHDFRVRRKCCKHIYFIVSRIAQNEQMLNTMKTKPKLTQTQYNKLDLSLVQRLKDRLDGAKKEQKDKLKDLDLAKLEEDKDCPICFDEMDVSDLTQCAVCKKFLHDSCMDHWKQSNDNCPMCRSAWKVDQGQIEDAFKKLKKINL
ncbi:hypothetical protein PPERSA_08593 [Pseudocohnilembus persalinus]|uniref:RING-type domain-containing protein n=1 Tax=Pseudocohnilembus persalinus TaxID=266149 RepID=A0A0V0R238_PSEPJ|nr:hypothetical protein PPERSA_08593 [Pseudocohnilembus persalinus]|eukprot:KRX08394.1 hypothetical protein PPERSA_08593 [Pseudocohnilembus persalinus]